MTPSRLPSSLLLSLPLAAFLGGSLLSPGPALAQDLPDWENPQVVGIHKLDPHAPVYPFADEATARTVDRSKSPYYRLLNGRWKFKFSPTPESRPITFFETAFDDTAWDTIPVPVEHRDAGLRAPDLREHRLRLGLGHAAAHPARAQLRRLVPPPLRRARRLARPPRADHVPRRLRGLLPLGQREEGRLQRGQPRPGRVRPHRLREARREPARRRGLPLHGRGVPRVPGLLADVGHLPRRRPVVHGARCTSTTSAWSPTSTRSTATPR